MSNRDEENSAFAWTAWSAGFAVAGSILCLIGALLLPLSLDWVDGPASRAWRISMWLGGAAGLLGAAVALAIRNQRPKPALVVATLAALLSLGSCWGVPQLLRAMNVYDEPG